MTLDNHNRKIFETNYEHLSIGIDWDYDATDKSQWTATMLYVPNKLDHRHEHIALSDRAATKLRDWLTWYLAEKGVDEPTV